MEMKSTFSVTNVGQIWENGLLYVHASISRVLDIAVLDLVPVKVAFIDENVADLNCITANCHKK